MRKKILVIQTIKTEIYVDAQSDNEAIEIGNRMIELDLLNSSNGELLEASVQISEDERISTFN